MTAYKYFKNLETGSIYRKAPVRYNDGTTGESLARYNWDFKNWRGHIHDHDKTRSQLEEGKVIVPISAEEAQIATGYDSRGVQD